MNSSHVPGDGQFFSSKMPFVHVKFGKMNSLELGIEDGTSEKSILKKFKKALDVHSNWEGQLKIEKIDHTVGTQDNPIIITGYSPVYLSTGSSLCSIHYTRI